MSDPSSILFDYTCQYYDLMKEGATEENQHGAMVLVFRGSVVRVFRGMSISQSYYSKVQKSLKDMGCITVLRQGGRGTDSVVVLHRAPTPEDWQNLSTDPLTPQLDLAILSQRVGDLADLVGGINVRSAIADLAIRLERVEREVERIGRTPTAKRKS